MQSSEMSCSVLYAVWSQGGSCRSSLPIAIVMNHYCWYEYCVYLCVFIKRCTISVPSKQRENRLTEFNIEINLDAKGVMKIVVVLLIMYMNLVMNFEH